MCFQTRNQDKRIQEFNETQVQREEFLQSSNPWSELSHAQVSPEAEPVHSLQRTVRKGDKPARLPSCSRPEKRPVVNTFGSAGAL